MGGGLMQLVAYGAQDIYLTGNPQITFFKVVYRRHTNFAMECVEQTLNGNPGNGVSVTATVSRNGDLVGKMYVTSSTTGITDGDSIINEVEVEIGGQKIDKHYKEWLQVWAELTTPDSKALAYKNMTGALSHGLNKTNTAGVNMVQIPLQFWFNRNPGLALPLIALQYHEVKIKMTLGSTTGTAGVKLWADYIYLDTDERRRFAQVSHEYLIEQIQREDSSSNLTHKLNFNHPVKELVWTSDITNDYGTAKLQLNGHDRFAAQEEEYFQLRQPMDHHTAVPGANIPMSDRPQQISSSGQLDLSTPMSVAEAPAATSTVGGNAGDFAIDADADTETLNGTSAAAGGAHLALYSTTAPGIKVGDSLLLIDYDDAAAAGTVLSEIVTVAAVDNASVTNRYAYRFTNNLQVIPDTAGSGAGNLTISLTGRLQDPLSRCSQLNKKVNVYSFALKPEEHQPSGTCNFSRIDNAKLVFSGSANAVTIYAVNYNVLRVMSGMGGLAYSN